MAMTMSGEVQLPATRETVWQKLNDPEVLKACIPGCETLEKTGEDAFNATVKIKVGPVSAAFKGSVVLTDILPLDSYRISGQGEGGIAGFAKGGASVRLLDPPDGGAGCLLAYDVEAQVGGKIAQLGSRLVENIAKKTADQFFSNFSCQVGASSPQPIP